MIFRFKARLKALGVSSQCPPLSWNPLSISAAACSGRFSDSKGFRFGGQKLAVSRGVEGSLPDRLGDYACPVGGSNLTSRGSLPDRLGLS